MTEIPRILSALFAGAMSVLILWFDHATTGLLVSCGLVLLTIYLAVPDRFDGFRKEVAALWASYKNPQSGAKP